MTGGAPRQDIPPDVLAAGMELMRALPDAEALRRLAGKAAISGRRRREPVAFRTAGEVLEAYSVKLISQAEARRLLGLPARKTGGRRPSAPSADRTSEA